MFSTLLGKATMHTLLLCGHAMLVVTLLAATTGAARAADPAAFDTVAIDRVIAAQMAANRLPGLALALAITRGGEVRAAKGYGSVRDGTPMTDRTQFRIASLSKSFTAVAVLQLVEAGRVERDVPMQRYLPDFTLADPAVAARITVRQLLNHTSGLADIGFIRGLAREQPTLATRVASLRDARPVAAPGAAFNYFEPNYQILARLVEVVSGEPFDAYLQAHVFAPLAMRDTLSTVTADAGTTRAERLAQGHLVVYRVPVAASELSGFVGDSSGVISMADDMAHYLAMQGAGGVYAGHTLLTRAHLELTHTPPAAPASYYGMGWLVGAVGGARTIEHNGVFSTFYAEAVQLPDSGYSVVLLYDEYALTSAALAFPRLKAGMVALLTGHAPPEGGLMVPLLGGILAALTLLGAGLALRSMVQLPRWAATRAARPCWRHAMGIVGAFAPGLLLLGLPQLLAASAGRYFDYVMLARHAGHHDLARPVR